MLVVDLRNTRINVYNYSVVGNKNSDIIYFYYPKKYQNYEVYVKALGQNVADKFRIHEPDIEVKDDCIRAKWVMPQSVTTNKDLQVQLEYDITLLGGGEIAQSKIVALKLQNTLDINGEVEPVYPSVLQELREDLDAEILHRQQGDTALHDEIVAENERAESIEGGLRTDLDNHTADKNNPHEVTKAQVGLGNVDNTSDQDKPISTAQQQALDNKVDKVNGKQLSTEDYTTDEKNKLAGIEAGAQVNVLEGVKVNNQPLTPTNKVVNIDLSSYAKIVDMETYGKTLAVSIDPQTYVLTMSLKDANGNILNTQTIDLPLETMVVSGSYDDTTKSLILLLKNGQTITIPVADLVSGLVSETQLATILAGYYNKTETDSKLALKEDKLPARVVGKFLRATANGDEWVSVAQDLTANAIVTLDGVDWVALKGMGLDQYVVSLSGVDTNYDFIRVKLSINSNNYSVVLSKNDTNKYEGEFSIDELTALHKVGLVFNGSSTLIMTCQSIEKVPSDPLLDANGHLLFGSDNSLLTTTEV